MSKSLVPILSFVLFTHIAFSQNYEIGLTLGSTFYNGDVDVVAKNLGTALRPAVGILGKYRLANNLVLRGQVLMGKLSASEKTHPIAWRQERGFAFVTQFTEVSGLLEWEFLTKGRMTAYAFGGVGMTFFNPKPTTI